MLKTIYLGNLTVTAWLIGGGKRDHEENVMIVKKYGVRIWSGFVWFRTMSTPAVVNLTFNFKDPSKRRIYLLDQRLPASVGVFCLLEVLSRNLKYLKQWTTNINCICFEMGQDYVHEIMFDYLPPYKRERKKIDLWIGMLFVCPSVSTMGKLITFMKHVDVNIHTTARLVCMNIPMRCTVHERMLLMMDCW